MRATAQCVFTTDYWESDREAATEKTQDLLGWVMQQHSRRPVGDVQSDVTAETVEEAETGEPIDVVRLRLTVETELVA